MRRILACAVAVMATPALSSAAVIFADDFDSYADTAALGAVWTLSEGTLDAANGNPSQSFNHPGTAAAFSGGNTNTVSFPTMYPGPGEKLILSGDFYDDGTSENKRVSIGLRDAAGANIIEMGMYNSPAHYAIRTVLFGAGSDAAWVAMPGTPTFEGVNVSVEGWHNFQAEITDSDVTFMLDLGDDGSIDSTYTATILQNGAFGFNQIRLGGPSDLSSAGGGVKFDNISLTLVPEPTTALLAAFCAVGAGMCRRR